MASIQVQSDCLPDDADDALTAACQALMPRIEEERIKAGLPLGGTLSFYLAEGHSPIGSVRARYITAHYSVDPATVPAKG